MTSNYRDPNFNVLGAVADNTLAAGDIVKTMMSKGLSGVVVTGTFFEQDEGAGDKPLRAFSPYGLSKGLTWQYFRFLSETLAFNLGKFVIPNPIGPFEEPRFCSYLIESWRKKQVPMVRTPLYVRDNVHVDLLALAYATYVERVKEQQAPQKLNPSYYVETQGAFAQRFADAISFRLGMDCPLTLLDQEDFSEPMIRINTDRMDGAALGWSEVEGWDNIAEFYR